MSLRKKLLPVILIIALLVSGVAHAMSAKELFATACENFEASKSYEYETKMVLDVKSPSIKDHFVFKSNILVKYIKEPITLQIKFDIKGYGDSYKMEVYGQEENDNLVMYANILGMVTRQDLPLTSPSVEELVKSTNSTDSLKMYKKITYEGTKKLNGKQAHVLTAVIKASDLEAEVLKQMRGADQMREAARILRNLEDQTVTIYIDPKTNQFMRIEMDLTQMMHSIYNVIETDGTDVFKYTVVQDLKNINKVKSFKAPSSIVKKAKANS